MPYHGNRVGSLGKMLRCLNPRFAVITSSLMEPEDGRTLRLLERRGIPYYLTRRGTVICLSDGKDLRMIQ
jgi:beta-lactamase superfamily II metal-dependent hydrolase